MEWVLAEALLAQSRDPRVLLATLCRGETSAERVETLRFLLQRLEDEAARGGGDALPEAAREVAAGYLVPLMRGLRARPAGATDCDSPAPHRRRLWTAAGAALRSCARLAGDSQLATTLAEEALRDLLAAGPAPGLEGSAEAAVEVLAAVGPCLRPREDGQLLERVVQAALSLALAGDGETAALAVGRLLPALGQSGGVVLRTVWGGLLAPSQPGRVGPRLQVLSALAERLLPEPGELQSGTDARRCARFWQTVQAGLALGEDALTRKRARYLLQRAVEVSAEHGADCICGPQERNGPSLFWWSEKRKDELLKFWENYILILETLEGNQIHVIKPVLPKLNNLFEYSVSEENVRPEQQDAGIQCPQEALLAGQWLLHPSWHLCIYKRMFESENKILTKEGVTHFLELYETKVLPFSPDFSEFIIGPLMDALSESSLYSRSPGQLMGSGSPLGLKLQRFLVTYVSLLPEELKSSFLLKFIQKMTSRHWCAVPILFLSRALASIPRCKALGPEGLLALRDVLQCTMATHQILLRGAAQGYLLQTALSLLDVENVSLSDISTFLLSLRQEESLGRGTSLWTELCEWLRVNESCFGRSSTCSSVGLQETCSLNAYVKNLVEEYVKPPAWEGETCWMPDWAEARLVALMVLLAVDVEGMKTQYSEKRRMQNVLRMFLDPLLDALGKLGTNAYMPVLKADRCLQLLVTLLHTCAPKGPGARDDEVSPLLQDLVAAEAESISQFVLRRLTMSELSTVSDLDRGHLYLQVLTELTGLHREVGWTRGSPVWRVISPLKTACVRHLQDTDSGQEPTLGRQVQRVVSMAALATVCKAMDQKPELQPDPPDAGPTERFLASLPLNQMLQKPCPEEQSSDFEESASSRGWGRIAAQYIHDQWVCLFFLLKKYHTLLPPSEGGAPEPVLPAVQMPERTLRSALDALTILPSDQVLPVFQCMRLLVPQLLASSESICIEAFNMAWKVICSLSNTQLIFWSNLKAFVQFVFDAKVLTIAAKVKGQAYFKIKEIMYKMIEMSAIKTGVFNTLITHCCLSWVVPASNVSPGSLSTAKHYGELVLEACVFGTVFRRDQRLIQDVQTFIENLGHDCAANVVIENTQREDHYVRICAVKFLCLLDGSNMSHKLFTEDLAVKLLDKDELVSTSRTRYYVNSQQHRVKNRVWQVLLVLFPRFDQNFLNRIIDKIFQAGFSNNQASIKYYIEWIIILILHKFPQFLPKFWDCFSYGEEHLKTSICTFLSVLSHFDIITQNIPEKKPLLKRALGVVLRWGLSHNFSVRLYALVALKKIWGMCKTWQVDDVDAMMPVIESSLSQVENVHGAGNAKKNWQRIQDHFFFATFHPLEDYCLETIFHILPRLSGLVEEEWIAIDKFTRFTDLPPAAGLQGYLCQTRLRELRPGDWAQQDIGSNSGEADSPSEWTDVQKKLIPWKNNIPELDLALVFQDRASKLGKSTGRLIVVASLIDKPTNLGGLCRTCEVFGASVLVVGNLQCVHDKQFQHLSVSAEQWLPLVEVKPPRLMDYLQQKKAEGYTVIGVEQTARSADLTQYCFPEKSLLLLGNEREGIPANLIQQLDVCVEIPQQGIVRSLNVHVSGALLVWEYTRQWLLRHGGARPEALPFRRSAAGAVDTSF
ncbi:probable methyltransferase TARBP1 isoform X2 [Artibeus jamaicensis]|uniref:probable methyltransferase TARBP1 isoform X2 n=1 Tax=Artibeus jamaicensis TaxID=9417 RepID=UPI00235AF2C2|nr:probable methyltransferase TARBP1 isoform X2 [Artibeus jamaicensis]